MSITIACANRAPTLNNDTATTPEDIAVAIDVLANDTDDRGLVPTTLTVLTAPTHGTATADGLGVIRYTPAANWNGTDTLTYRVCDTDGACGSGTVTVTVTPVNDAPSCSDVTGNGPAGSFVVLSGSCTDIDSDSLAYEIRSTPPNATATVDTNGTIRVSAAQAGTVAFTYGARDASVASPPAAVTVTVTAPPPPPPPTRTLELERALIRFNRNSGGSLTFSGSIDRRTATCPTLKLQVAGTLVIETRTSQVRRSSTCAGTSDAGQIKIDLRSGEVSGKLTLPHAFTLTSNDLLFTLTVNEVSYGTTAHGRRHGQLWKATGRDHEDD